MAAKITREILESLLHCRYKAYLKLTGQQGHKTEYEGLIAASRAEVRLNAIQKSLARLPEGEVARNIPLTDALLQKGETFVLDATLEDDLLSLNFDGLKRVPGSSKLGDFHYVPMLFHEGRQVGKEQRLLLELYGLLLSQVQGHAPATGIVWHGRECKVTTMRLNPDLRKTEQLLRELKELDNVESPPKLILNDHCHVCEFRQRCHKQALEEDNISLLRGISEKEVQAYARQGIFTVTQLAHTFRPCRKGKREAQRTHRHYHALQALAIRDKRIHILGKPELTESPVRVYLDVESDPDEGYTYLIGMIVVDEGSERRYSFWANSKEQECTIFEEFLDEISRCDDFRVFCYGGYERAFLKRMRMRTERTQMVDRLLSRLVNTLSLVYSYVYFPTYSNGLKDIGNWLGCSWSEPDASGLQSIVWRKTWETTKGIEWKQKLTTYNLEDCTALKRVTELVYAAIIKMGSPAGPVEIDIPPVVRVQDIDKWADYRKWGRVNFVHPDYEYINSCAYFDYQRERVYVRTNRTLKKSLESGTKNHRRKPQASRHFKIASSRCPACDSEEITTGIDSKQIGCPTPRVKKAYDLVFTEGGIRSKVIECRSSVHQCLKCGHAFVPEEYQRLDKHFHGLKSWAIYQHVAHRLSLGTIQSMLEDFFGLHIHYSEVHMLKSLMAQYYQGTYQHLLQKILSGHLLHADETEVKLQTGKGYVWVFTNLEEVVFMYRPTRQGEFLRELLKDFHGVLVTDFYTAYDSIDCPQQKCLIHLMRDINQELLNNPYDEELQSITRPFGSILRAVVATVDEHGLKRRYLKKHKQDVAGYFRHLSERSLRSEAAELLRKRLMKYQNKLFTFIDHDGVPWNNNNAENAIKRFAYYREETTGLLKEAGLIDYLVLLSICQTCRYKGISFLRFLVSGGQDVDAFRDGKPPRRPPSIQIYPTGFIPPHLASLHRWKSAQECKRSSESQDEEM
jgi:predicted RecB family nuclease